MDIYILGIDHEIQVADSRRTQEDKEKFTELLEKIFTEQV